VGHSLHSFLTHCGGTPRTYGLVVDRRWECSEQAIRGLGELGGLANDHPGACAFGKIVVLAAEGVLTFQATAAGKVWPAFCGNSTAAAIACLGGRRHRQITLHGVGSGPYKVSARLAGNAILQTWFLPPSNISERRWRGRAVAFLQALNSYAIVRGDLPDGMSPEAARRELLGPCDNGKLAVISSSGEGTIVRFYNSNGRHGAVPQTGVASIALAARSFGWLGECFADGHIRYANGDDIRRERLPLVAEGRSGSLSVTLAAIEVRLSPLIGCLAA
jgi:hypothetical protein